MSKYRFYQHFFGNEIFGKFFWRLILIKKEIFLTIQNFGPGGHFAVIRGSSLKGHPKSWNNRPVQNFRPFKSLNRNLSNISTLKYFFSLNFQQKYSQNCHFHTLFGLRYSFTFFWKMLYSVISLIKTVKKFEPGGYFTVLGGQTANYPEMNARLKILDRQKIFFFWED